MTHKVTLIPGNEGEPTALADCVKRVVDAVGVDIDWQVRQLDNHSPTDELLESVRETRTALMPFLKGRRDEGIAAPVVQLRRALDVFANIRPVHSLPDVNRRFSDVDLMVVRETTEDVYASLEHESIPGTFESLKVTTEAACRRISKFAFELARSSGRKKITTVHKSNIMKRSDGMFLEVSREIAEDYPDIEHNERIVDALCMQLVMYPDDFDILLCGNLFGDIVADLAAGLVGGKDNCPSVNVGKDGVKIFTAGHGRDSLLANSEKGNPMSLLFASVLMLRDLSEHEPADRLMKAIETTLSEGSKPIVLGGDRTLEAFSEEVARRLAG